MKVSLISHTSLPLETLYSIWTSSRTDGHYMDPVEIRMRIEQGDTELAAEVEKTFEKMLDMQIPVTENIYFTFILDDVSVSLREQLVRHRIGVRVGERLGTDFIPDFAGSTWWAQSMRILDMGKFATRQSYRIPESLKDKHTSRGVSLEAVYRGHMEASQNLYNLFVQEGIPMEEAREVIPLAATHRISWTLSLAALQHIISKRACWILQLGLWKPLVQGMVEELRTKVHPIFGELVRPGCLDASGEFKGCMFAHDNERRLFGEDSLPPCALWLTKSFPELIIREGKAWQHDEEVGGPGRWFKPDDPILTELFLKMCEDYTKLWGRNVFDGASVNE